MPRTRIALESKGSPTHRQPRRKTPLTNETTAPLEVNVGRRLRELRAEHNLSIRALAERSGLAVNTLRLIENSRTSPSVGTLQQIAVALDVPITAFFETDAPKNKVAYVKTGQRPRAAFAPGTLEELGGGLAGGAVGRLGGGGGPGG